MPLILKPLPFDSRYFVSNYGDVYSLMGKKITKRKPRYDKSRGYILLNFRIDKKHTTKKMHQLVWHSFHGEYDYMNKAEVVNHINGDKTDNRLSNLELIKQSENVKHAYRTGLRKKKIECPF